MITQVFIGSLDYMLHTVKPKDGAEFDDSEFTPRQIHIMAVLVDQYRGSTPEPPQIPLRQVEPLDL